MELVNLLKQFIEKGNLKYFDEAGFCATASAIYKVSEAEVWEALAELLQEGFLVSEDGKLVRSATLGLLSGPLSVTLHGYGFCTVDIKKPDIYIAREDMNGALNGDRVLISVSKERGKMRGQVVKVLARGVRNIVGAVMHSKGSAFIIPDDESLGQDIEIDGGRDIAVGQKVVARFGDNHGKKAVINEILGDPKSVGVDILSIIRHYNLYQEFPQNVVNEARKVAKSVDEAEIKRRVDYRDKIMLTIDPDDAKDLDDAISFEKLKDGTFELGVHIADVSHFVREGSELDKESFKRGTSVYFCDRVLPMLPTELSNGVCSLSPTEPRLALSVVMKIDKKGNVLEHQIAESVIQVTRRLNYDEVQKMLDMEDCKDVHIELLREMANLTVQLERGRHERGEVVFDMPEPKIVLDPKTGKIKDVVAYPHHLSHRIIESFMILCNEVVAEKMCALALPFIYRIHETPDPMRVARFVESLKPFAIQHRINPENATGKAYQDMLAPLAEEIKPIISSLALRSMQKAKYSPECVGHFGLGSQFYCHFTAPIRRYPDLVIHRIIKLMLNRKLSSHKLEELTEYVRVASEQSSKTEVAATEAEREVDNLKRAEYMRDHIGEQFSGHISGIADFGVFVYLPNTVEGLIKIENMPNDTYKFNEQQSTLIGRRRTWKMGDKIDVIVASVNMPRRQVEFSAVK